MSKKLLLKMILVILLLKGLMLLLDWILHRHKLNSLPLFKNNNIYLDMVNYLISNHYK